MRKIYGSDREQLGRACNSFGTDAEKIRKIYGIDTKPQRSWKKAEINIHTYTCTHTHMRTYIHTWSSSNNESRIHIHITSGNSNRNISNNHLLYPLGNTGWHRKPRYKQLNIRAGTLVAILFLSRKPWSWHLLDERPCPMRIFLRETPWPMVCAARKVTPRSVELVWFEMELQIQPNRACGAVHCCPLALLFV